MTKQINVEQLLTHFPPVSQELVDYARDEAFLESRYLFVWRVRQVQMAYCTHCQTEYPIGVGKASYKHNEKTTCLNCSSECVVKSNGRGRSHLIDSNYIVWYEKSVIDPNVVVASAFYAYRDYSGDYRTVQTMFAPCALYIFDPGKGGIELRQGNGNKWTPKRSVTSYIATHGWSFYGYSHTGRYCSQESIKAAVSDSVLRYSMWHEYEDDAYDFVKFFDLAAKYPCVEYLTKLGLNKLVRAKLKDTQTYGVINWRGKSIEKVLRLPRAEIKSLLQLAGEVDPMTLRSYHYWRKEHNWDVTPFEANMLKGLVGDTYYWKMLEEHQDIYDIVRYLLKQMGRSKTPARASITGELSIWRDYLRFCKKLGIDVNQAHYRFPNNLREAHDKMMRRVKLKRSEELNRRIEERGLDLERYTFNDGTLVIRPVKNSQELFDEGKALVHCVGSYADDYAAGSKDIFVLRRASDPGTPFCTVEVSGGKIRQARGLKNAEPDAEVQKFLKRFMRNRSSVEKRQTRSVQAMAG